MSNLSSLFDVVRGYHGPNSDYSTITERFEPDATLLSSNQLTEGDLIQQNASGLAVRASGNDWRTAAGTSAAALADSISDSPHIWLVVGGAGADEYDGLAQTGTINAFGVPAYQSKVVACIRGTYMAKTQNIVARTYVPGQRLTVVSGQLDQTVTGGTNPGFQPYGEVREYDATNSLLTYTAGC